MSTGYSWEGIRQVCATLLGVRYVIVIPLPTVEYTSVSQVYSTVDSGITNLIHGCCKLSGASSGC